MNWKALCLLATTLIVFSFPVISGAPLPDDYSAEQISEFLGQIMVYWMEVFIRVMKKFEPQFLDLRR